MPLVKRRSLERQAFANMGGAAYVFDKNVEEHMWRFAPEQIPDDAWAQLGLEAWESQPSWLVFDRFSGAYGALFHHIDHMADFARCSVDLDELGEEILVEYLTSEQEQTNPLLQETFDACASLLGEFSELDEPALSERPDIVNCRNLIVAMKDALLPKEDFEQEAQLTITEIAAWRDRLRAGFSFLGEARGLWLADSLGIECFHYPDASGTSQ